MNALRETAAEQGSRETRQLGQIERPKAEKCVEGREDGPNRLR